MTDAPQPAPRRGLGREILALALPAFATLVSEPLLLMADSAMVGHLGTLELGALGVIGKPFDPMTLPAEIRKLVPA